MIEKGIPDVESLLRDSIVLELNTLKGDEEVKEVLELIAFIQSSGIYLYMSNEMAEAFSHYTANKLSVRQFAIGVTERFLLKLALTAPDLTSSAKYVSDVLSSLNELTVANRSLIQHPGSLFIAPVQANLVLKDSKSVVEHNPAFFILYLAEVTGAFRSAIAEFTA